MTLHEIATAMRLTQAGLRANDGKGAQHDPPRARDRRAFVLKAFAEGHAPEAICTFIDRTPVMVLHALRMGCMQRAGGQYGRTLEELTQELRRVAA
jgi:hypothetical protein